MKENLENYITVSEFAKLYNNGKGCTTNYIYDLIHHKEGFDAVFKFGKYLVNKNQL